MRLLYFGSDKFSLACLDGLLEAQKLYSRLELVVPKFGNRLMISKAEQLGLKYHIAPPKSLLEWNVPGEFDMAVVISFGYFIPASVLSRFKCGGINIHPSLLPKYRGSSPIQYTILNRDAQAGVSVIELSPVSFDSGRILLQESINIQHPIGYNTLHDRLGVIGKKLLVSTLKDFDNLRTHAKEQNNSEVSKAPKISKEMAHVNWDQSIDKIFSLYLAIGEKIPLYSFFREKRVQMTRISIIQQPMLSLEGADSGVLYYDRRKSQLFVKAQDGWVRIEKLRMEDYKFGEIIGRGAKGIVYKSLNNETGELVAIKQTIAKVTDLLEIDLLERLEHPNIVKFFGCIQKPGSYLIIMEYCEAGSLFNMLNKFGTMSEHLASGYIQQVLSGLSYLHKQGVIHRDIKAANILTTKAGVAKLGDFGIAVDIRSGEALFNGSPFWMAPEVIDLHETRESDVWSVGCLTVELLTGAPPYYNLDPMSALFKIASSDFYPYPPNISVELQDFLIQCFQKDPNLRITSCRILQHPWLTKVKSRKLNLSTEHRIAKRVNLEKYREDDEGQEDYSKEFMENVTLSLKIPEVASNELIEDELPTSDHLETFSIDSQWTEEKIKMIKTRKVSSAIANLQPTSFLEVKPLFENLLAANRYYEALQILKLFHAEKNIDSYFGDHDKVQLPLDLELGLLTVLCSGGKRASTFSHVYVATLISVISKIPSFSFERFKDQIEDILQTKFAHQFVKSLRELIEGNGNGHDKALIKQLIACSNIPILVLKLLESNDSSSAFQNELTEFLLQLSNSSADIRSELALEVHIRSLLDLMKFQPVLILKKLLKVLKNLLQMADLEKQDCFCLIEFLCEKLWILNGSHDLEIPFVILVTLSSVLRLSKERLQFAVEHGILECLFPLAQIEKPSKQFAVQIICDILGYAKIPKLYHRRALDLLLGLIDNICWRSAAYEALVRLKNRDPSVGHLFLDIDFTTLFKKASGSFNNMQDNFLSQFLKLIATDDSLSVHMLSNGILSPLVSITSNNPTVLIDLLWILKKLYICDKSHWLKNTSDLEMLVQTANRLANLSTSVLISGAAAMLLLSLPK